MSKTPILECQDCGDRIRELTAKEAQDMAIHPYNWIAFCTLCRQHQKEF